MEPSYFYGQNMWCFSHRFGSKLCLDCYSLTWGGNSAVRHQQERVCKGTSGESWGNVLFCGCFFGFFLNFSNWFLDVSGPLRNGDCFRFLRPKVSPSAIRLTGWRIKTYYANFKPLAGWIFNSSRGRVRCRIISTGNSHWFSFQLINFVRLGRYITFASTCYFSWIMINADLINEGN